VSYKVVACTFEREVQFICPDAIVANALAPLSARPGMLSPTIEGIQLQIVSAGTGFYDFNGGDLGRSPGTTTHIFSKAQRYIDRLLLSEASPNPALIAGSMVLADRRFVILADDHFDRLAFMMYCLSMGAKVEGAGLVSIHEETVMSFPKRLYVESSTAQLFPQLMKRVLASPHFLDWHGRVIHAIDPGAASDSGELCRGRANAIIFLEPNGGGSTSAGRLPPDEGLGRVIKNAIRVQPLNGVSFAKLHRLTRAAACWKLRLGNFNRSLWHLERIAELAGT